jgi:amidase
MTIDDTLNAFVQPPGPTLPGAATGPLAGLTFAAKDIFDIAGTVTGCGNPDWVRTHPPAARTAWAIQALLDAGARHVGKTLTDELAFSIDGENHHYGTPVNPRAPGRICGGSSCGSAAAVAGGLVDLALGTDTGGSVRAPASFCGLWGIRPSHGAVPLDGVMKLAPSFDTVGWFARSARLLRATGEVLLPAAAPPSTAPRLLFLADLADALAPDHRRALDAAVVRAEAALGPARTVRLGIDLATDWLPAFQALQWREIWETHGEWIRTERPTFGPGLAERFAAIAGVTDAEVTDARRRRQAITARLHDLLGAAGVLVGPTVPFPPPLVGRPIGQRVADRQKILSFLCPAGLARLPQLSMPLTETPHGPLGLSLTGPPGADRWLTGLAVAIAET